ncbi:MAG: F0F1 ATP synthase subunit delta [Christensenellales bacterium]|jgi:F0F1-type ATP synthase delta subunit
MREIIVKTSKPLTDSRIKSITDVAVSKYGKDAAVKFLVDESLIGGIIIYDNGKVINNTLINRLNTIKEMINNE